MCGMDNMLQRLLAAGTIGAHEAYMKALDKKLFEGALAAEEEALAPAAT